MKKEQAYIDFYIKESERIEQYFSSPYRYNISGVDIANTTHTSTITANTKVHKSIVENIQSPRQHSKQGHLQHKVLSAHRSKDALSPIVKNIHDGIDANRMFVWIFVCILLASIVLCSFITQSNMKFMYPTLFSINDNLVIPTAILREPINDSNDTVANDFSEVGLKKYTLKSGDFLINVAKAYNVSIDSIISWNNIKDARRVQIGDEIIIPNRSGVLHKVKRGESIESLAKKYNIKTTSILDANNLQSTVISKGSKLFLPNAKMDAFELDLALGNLFLSPTRGYISSSYGYRKSPITGKWHFHGALDIANRFGTPIVAATYGTVVNVIYGHVTNGNMVIMAHPGGFKTTYSHMRKIYVKKGQRVSRGRTLGEMGSTGWSTGSHLHFAVYRNGKSINPLKYIRVFR